MKKKMLLVMAAVLGLVLAPGCSTLNPETGEREFDPVKTEKVQAVLKNAIADAVLFAAQKDPNALPYLEASALVVCSLADAEGSLDSIALRTALDAASVNELKTVEAQMALNAVVGLYEAALADKWRADVDANAYANAILDTLCEGLTLGVGQAKELGLAP